MITCLERSLSFGLLCVFRERLSISVCVSFPFGFEAKMADLVVLMPDHCHV